MLNYVIDIVFEDPLLERTRRVELYREQVEKFEAMLDGRMREGPYARPVYCAELADQFPHGFASVRAAAEWIGVDRSHLRMAISKGCRCRGYRFVYLHSQREGTGRERPVVCLSDGVVKRSVTQAAAYAGVTASTLCGALRDAKGGPAYCGGKMWQYAEDARTVQLYLFDPGQKKRLPRPFVRRPRLASCLVQLDLFAA